MEELLAAEQCLKFTREFWAGKIDLPGKEMFKLLKNKNLREIIPPLIDDQGIPIEGEATNLEYVHTFFSNNFAKDTIKNENITANRTTISRIKLYAPL